MTSASSTSSPVSKSSDLPLIVQTETTSKTLVYVPQHRRSQRRMAHVAADKSKTDVCRYRYQGGQTSVMTGGVMLGAAKPVATTTKPRSNISASASAFGASITTLKPRTAKVMLGPDSSNNWRSRARV
jgi:hypothetical protein